MTRFELVMVLAVLLAPLIAVQVQKYLELLRERQKRKLNLFHALMATRAARVSPAHVQALNMIDIEFYGRKIFWFRYQSSAEKAIVEAWKIYLDHLAIEHTEEEFKNWADKGDDLFTELLYKMAQCLGYHFDKVHLKRGIYSPKAHGIQERELLIIRESLAKILTGEQAIPMEIVSLPISEETLKKQDAVQTRTLEYLEGKRAVKVKVVNEKEEPPL